MTNYFQSFDLTPSFAIDQAALEARYEQLMVLCHPDKFAGAAVAPNGQIIVSLDGPNDETMV